MNITTVIEREDGGADVMLENVSAWELQALLQAGFVALLEEYAAKEKEKNKVPFILRGDSA